MRVAIDAMGGDRGPAAVVDGAAAFLESDDTTEVYLVGRAEEIEPILKAKGLAGHARLQIHHASQVIEMGEKLASLRRKTDASILRAVELVRDGEAQAVVAIGNTMAAVAGATLKLRTVEGVHRPGIAVPLPSKAGQTLVVDMGANTMPRAEHLVDYAVMASVYAHELFGVEDPRVGLLNVGEELGKGNPMLREAYELLEKAPIRFAGNAEGSDIYRGTFDVVVCDGFVGNAVLKASEAVAELFLHFLREELDRSIRRKIGALMSKPAFYALRRRTDYAEVGGALLLGVKGIVIIGHGKSDARAVQNAIRVARDAAQRKVNEKIRSRLQSLSDTPGSSRNKDSGQGQGDREDE